MPNLESFGAPLTDVSPVPKPLEASVELPVYQYTALPDDESIRMLILHPGTGDEPLHGHLEFFNVSRSEEFTPAEQYEPLSYVWGSSERSHQIVCSGAALGLTSSLHDALKRLRLPNKNRRLWADQICINQHDTAERSQQVQYMNKTYKNAKHVLVWLGRDDQSVAEQAFQFVRELDETFSDKEKLKQFEIDHKDDLESLSKEPWIPLTQITKLPWFTRAWIVQEIGTQAPATLFWGNSEIDWRILHRVCEKLTDFHHLRKHFRIRTDLIKYVFRRFIEPEMTSRHANRFNFMYELHRGRHLQVTDSRDRVFAMLGHYSVCNGGNKLLQEMRANYENPWENAYTDVATRALVGDDSSLITLAAVQHKELPFISETPESSCTSGPRDLVRAAFPSWVPNWEPNRELNGEIYETHILSEPISPHWAHDGTKTRLKIEESVLSIDGILIDAVEAVSEAIVDREFHLDSSGRALAIEGLWRNICNKTEFNLEDKYPNNESALFAYLQTLSNGGAATASRDTRPYREILNEEWFSQGAAYLTKALGKSDNVSPLIYKVAEGGDDKKWSRAANGASKNRKFARTSLGYYVLGPKVMEKGDVVCVFYGGKMPFCLRPWGQHYLLVGECYVHGLMHGEALKVPRNEFKAKTFELV